MQVLAFFLIPLKLFYLVPLGFVWHLHQYIKQIQGLFLGTGTWSSVLFNY